MSKEIILLEGALMQLSLNEALTEDICDPTSYEYNSAHADKAWAASDAWYEAYFDGQDTATLCCGGPISVGTKQAAHRFIERRMEVETDPLALAFVYGYYKQQDELLSQPVG